MCETLIANDDAPGTLLQAVADLGKGISYTGYDSKYLSNTTIDINNSSRQWTY